MSSEDDTANPTEHFTLEVARNIKQLQCAPVIRDLSNNWLRDTLPYHYSYNFSWLGRPIIQYPQDIVAVQELIWRVKPDLIIETGVAHGGSLILSAGMLALIDYCEAASSGLPLEPRCSDRRVIGIDIDIRAHNRFAIEQHGLAHKIDLIQGSSIAKETVSEVRHLAAGHKSVMVFLDSNHTHDHVLAELEAFAPLVSPGSYCVVFDTIIELLPSDTYPARPWSPGNSPLTAVRAFVAQLDNRHVLAADGKRLRLEPDTEIDSKLLISVAPGGYLRRTDE